MQIQVLHNQSLFDTALQHTGSITGIFDLAMTNDVSITDDITAGGTLSIPQGISTESDILGYYTAKNIQPATAFTKQDIQVLERLEGISIWAINTDFIIS